MTLKKIRLAIKNTAHVIIVTALRTEFYIYRIMILAQGYSFGKGIRKLREHSLK